MGLLTDEDVLRLWEVGRGQRPLDRNLTILGALSPHLSRPELASLPVGRRDAMLLEAHRSAFGHSLHSYAECPACGMPLEVVQEIDRLVNRTASDEHGREYPLTSGEYALRFRLADSEALGRAAAAADANESRRILVSYCVTEARLDGRTVQPDNVPDAVLDDLGREMERLDPQADLRFGLDCPECGHQWELGFDAGEYLWTGIVAAARRLLTEVDALARAYGWSEPEILALGPARRAAYLDLAL